MPLFSRGLALLLCLIGQTSLAQIISMHPAEPRTDDRVTLIYDANLGNGRLADYPEEVYMHSGVILSDDPLSKDWKYVQGEWGKADQRVKMQRVGRDKYRISFHIRTFYGIPENQKMVRMAFVFRSKSGEIIGADRGDLDIFYPPFHSGEITLPAKADLTSTTSAGDVINQITLRDGSLILEDGTHTVMVRVFKGGIANIQFSPDGKSLPKQPELIIPPDQLIPINSHNDTIDIPLHSDYRLSVSTRPIRINLFKNGKPVLTDNKGLFYGKSEIPDEPQTGAGFTLGKDESLYGGGFISAGLRRNGVRIPFYNSTSIGDENGLKSSLFSLPAVISSLGYAILFDHGGKGLLDLGKEDSTQWRYIHDGDYLSYFLIPLKDSVDITRQTTLFTGKQSLPPRWVFGSILSPGKDAGADPRTMLEMTNLPVDGLILGSSWLGGEKSWGNFDWDRRYFPQPAELIEGLAQKQVHTILPMNPYVYQGTDNFNRLNFNKFLAKNPGGKSYIIENLPSGTGGLIDIFHPEAQEWWWYWYKKQIELGVDGWQSDMGQLPFHPAQMIHHTGSAGQVHNQFPLQWARMIEEGYHHDFPDRRPVNFTRSGLMGSGRYGTIPVAGQIHDWETLRNSLANLLMGGISGLPYTHSEILPTEDEELFRRSTQLAVFLPVMHLSFTVGEYSAYIPAIEEAIRLRYRILPYLYTLGWETANTGTALARPVIEHDSTGKTIFSEDEYLLGNDLLIAPVFAPGLTERKAYFPAGNWRNLFNGEYHTGGQSESVVLHEDQIPVFIREGSFLPMAENILNASEFTGDSLVIHHYPSIQTSGSTGYIYLDDGLSAKAMEKQDYRLIKLQQTSDAKSLRISLVTTGNGFNAANSGHFIEFRLQGILQKPRKIFMDGRKIPLLKKERNPDNLMQIPGAEYNENQQMIRIFMEWDGAALDIEIRGKILRPN